MEPYIYGDNIQQSRLKVKLGGKIYQAWGGITSLGEDRYSVGQLIIHINKNKIDP